MIQLNPVLFPFFPLMHVKFFLEIRHFKNVKCTPIIFVLQHSLPLNFFAKRKHENACTHTDTQTSICPPTHTHTPFTSSSQHTCTHTSSGNVTSDASFAHRCCSSGRPSRGPLAWEPSASERIMVCFDRALSEPSRQKLLSLTSALNA